MSEEHHLVQKPLLTFIGPKSSLADSFFAYVLQNGIAVNVYTKDSSWKVGSGISSEVINGLTDTLRNKLDAARYICIDARDNDHSFSEKDIATVGEYCVERSYKLLILCSIPTSDSYKNFVNEHILKLKNIHTTIVVLDNIAEDEKTQREGAVSAGDILESLYISLIAYRQSNKVILYSSNATSKEQCDIPVDELVVVPKPRDTVFETTPKEDEQLVEEVPVNVETITPPVTRKKKKKKAKKRKRLQKNIFVQAGYGLVLILLSFLIVPLVVLFSAEIVGNISNVISFSPLISLSTTGADFAKTYSLVLPSFMKPYSHFLFAQSSQTFLDAKDVYFDSEIDKYSYVLSKELVTDGAQKTKTEDYSHVVSARLVQKYVNNQLQIDESENTTQNNNLYLTSYFLNEVPYLTGVETPKVYIFVLYDAQKITPVGGIVKSVYKLTFSGGSILDIQELSVDEINEKIGESVDVTRPMKEIFGEDTVYSLNTLIWDSHYPKVAKDTKWVLEKVFNQQTDGVFYLPENLFAENLLNAKESFAHFSKSESLEFLKMLTKSFTEKQAHAYFFDPSVESIASALSTSSEVSNPECAHCDAGFIGTSDIQTSEEKIDLKKQVNVLYSFEEGVLKANATVFIKNTSDNTYTGFSSLLTNPEVGFSPVEVVKSEGREDTAPLIFTRSGYKEAGVRITIDPHQIVALVFKWEKSLTSEKEKEYSISLIKQNGIGDYTRTLEVKKVPEVKFDSLQGFILTEGGNYRYNSKLSADETISFTLTKQ